MQICKGSAPESSALSWANVAVVSVSCWFFWLLQLAPTRRLQSSRKEWRVNWRTSREGRRRWPDLGNSHGSTTGIPQLTRIRFFPVYHSSKYQPSQRAERYNYPGRWRLVWPVWCCDVLDLFCCFLGDGKDRGCVRDITGYPACSVCIVSLAGFVVLLFKFIVPVLLVFGLRLVSFFLAGKCAGLYFPHLSVGFLCLVLYPIVRRLPAAASSASTTTLSHTTLSHTIFRTQFCVPTTLSHTQSFTHNPFMHNSFTYNLSHTILSHTTLSHTIYHTHTTLSQTHTHTIFHAHTHNLSPAALSHTTLSHTLTFVLHGRRGVIAVIWLDGMGVYRYTYDMTVTTSVSFIYPSGCVNNFISHP